ncbi:ABC transporter substrate-binding protein [Nitrosopumilus cobalaminigenes]|uniref:ABC transporter substrate-binding protein n=1 Tax=Nitrosopumilus cobalaminigenes TaxID=1470066 RepID=A0A7D5M1Q0_9ARCH|nr:ABC transporter substrate-binding protein [Nitrosopumilus cobalaminigenes]QLH03751.1 ABC transporter substrate-binding protein [Nitrosopumilus cobalaminigenes]
MKSTQLLSVVFSLIMFTGVTAGNTAFAESDDLDDILEDFCEMTLDERSDTISKYDLDDYAEKLVIICEIEDDDEREESLWDVMDAIDPEIRDELEDELDDIIEDFEDCVEAGYPIMESYPEQCMTDDGTVFTNTDDDDDDYDDDDRYENDFDLDDLLDDYCKLNDEEKRQLLADHPRLAPFTDRLANYCEMSEDEQDAIDDLIEEHGDKIRAELRDYSKDYRMDYKKDMREHLEKYCEMSDEDRRAYVAEHDKAEDHIDKMNRYCSLDEDDRMDFIEEHRDEYKAHMQDKMHDKMSDKMHDKMTDKKHMDYDRLCAMAESDRAAEITDVAKLDRISKWCKMTPEEREDYKKEHHGEMKDKMHDKIMDKKHAMKLSEKSDRIKAMIMDKRDISDEKREEIKMKFIEKHGDLTDEKKSELKMKFKNHMKHMKHNISDERKSEIHDRLAEMKAYKAELRANSSDLTDEEKQELREEFIEKAKDLQLAWITPRTQIAAGIDAAEVECREGFSLVMKASNGVPMCLKADTALKMIDRGIVVPAN